MEEKTRKEKRQEDRAERRANKGPKKPFFDTKVGSGLKAVAGLVAPQLVSALEGVEDVASALGIIRHSDSSPETKAQLQEFVLAQYELEVEDRMSARERELKVLKYGGNNYLMNVLGWGATALFALMSMVMLGVIEIPDTVNKEYMMFASGAISSAFMTVLAYYFGSSVGSKQKTNMMHN